MQLLTIRVNRRINHTVNFDGAEARTECFILQHAIGGSTNLFGLYQDENVNSADKKKLKIPVISQNDKAPTVLWVHKIYCEKTNEESPQSEATSETEATNAHEHKPSMPSYRLHVVLGEKEEEAKLTLPPIFRYRYDKCEVFYCNAECPANVTVDFDLCISNNVVRTISISLFLGVKESITDVVLDFGSESSQLGIFNRGEDLTTNDRYDLFDMMMKNYWHKENTDRKDSFRQYESIKLFRSIFYVKERITRNEFNALRKEIKPKNKILRILCLRSGDETKQNGGFIPVPNTKICDFGITPYIRIGQATRSLTEENVLPNACIHPFIYAALKQIHDSNKYASQQRHFVTLRMLIPNVYSHRRTIRLINAMADYANQLIGGKGLSSIYAVQVSAVSESDASLIGLISSDERGQYKAGDYLILDAGKGTLDFSIMNYDGTRYFKNLYRSGIIGAGNAISYGYFLGFLKQFIKEYVVMEDSIADMMRRFIYHGILGYPERDSLGNEVKWQTNADSASLHALTDCLDRYKKGMYNSGTFTVNDNNKKNEKKIKINEIKLDTFVRWLGCQKPGSLSDDEQEYVTAIIESITDDVKSHLSFLKRIESLNIVSVAFTGRAFGSELFKNSMKTKLMELFGLDNRIFLQDYSKTHDSEFAKYICLFVAPTLSQGGYNHHILSAPFCLKDDGEISNKHEESIFRKY